MCRCLALLLATFSTAALCSDLPAGVTPKPGRLTILLEKIESTTAATAAVIRSEVAATLETAGVDVRWHDGRGEVSGRLAVIRLTGSCLPVFAPIVSVGGFAPRTAEALGLTHVTDGKVLSFAEVRCDQIRKYAGEAIVRATHSDVDREAMLGRAIARVAVHEVYHILLGTTKHGKSGIAKASQTPEQLIATRLNFAPQDEQAISASVASHPHGEFPVSGASTATLTYAAGEDSERR